MRIRIGMVVLLALLTCSPRAEAQTGFNGLETNLSNLYRTSDAQTRSICPENFTGEKGKAGMSTDGPALPAARDLGQGWKVSPYVRVAAKSTLTLGEINGSGAIQQIWMTPAPIDKTRHFILRFYWDGETTPSIEVPMGDFFACGWGQYCQINSLPVCVNPGSAFNCYWTMPFRKGAKVTLENLDDNQMTIYYQINYTLTDVPEDAAYMHAQFRRVGKLPVKTVYTILDGVRGRGQYVGTYMAWEVRSPGWWGEGEIKFFLDGDQEFPTICGTGTEDYFCGSYNFENREKKLYQTFSTPHSGLAQVLPPDVVYLPGQRFGLYRWHIADPIRFQQDLKVTIQALGWMQDKPGRYLPLEDDISSVAFWYQTEPHAAFPALPQPAELSIKPIQVQVQSDTHMSVAFILLALAAPTSAVQSPENLAFSRSYTVQPAPNYGHCTDPGDVTQLTDGAYTADYFWTQPTTVGWQGSPVVLITIDLGQTQPIAGISYSAAAGVAGVTWPREIRIALSDDGRQWRSPGNLVALSRPNGQPPSEGYGLHRYVTRDLASRGRYVRLAVITQGPYTFCDEIEILRGPDALLDGLPRDPVTVDAEAATPMGWSEARTGIFRRLSHDLDAAYEAIERAELAGDVKTALRERLDGLKPSLFEVPEPDLATFRTVFPLNDTHAAILASHASLMRARGFGELFVWRKHRFDSLAPHETPPQPVDPPALDMAMMKGEFRADAFLLTNASERAVTARVRVAGLPGAPDPAWLTISAVPWTDTAQRVPVAAALPAAVYADGAYLVPAPAGMTTKVWLTIDSSHLAPGTYTGLLALEAPGYREELRFSVRVSPVAMSTPRLSLGMWDYTNGTGVYGLTAKNLESAIAMERSHLVDSPWATAAALPWPAPADFDAQGNLTAALSFAEFDAWISRWPGARNYLVFAAVGPSFAGASSDAPEFAPRVGSWARALAQHMRDRQLRPSQLGLLLVDEPSTDEQDAVIIAWAKAIKAAAPELTIFQDPCWVQPAEARLQEAITLADIVCPQLAVFHAGGPPAMRYYEQRRDAGQRLWFYQCSGPARVYDPSRYHRLAAWHAFRYGAVGLGFWAFGDTGGGVSSWNEYVGTRTAFAPAFIDVDRVTDGVHWQAVREGMEDYEYLAMLRDAAATRPEASRAEAERLLQEASEAVIGTYTPDWTWAADVDRTVPDTYRLRVLDLLERWQ